MPLRLEEKIKKEEEFGEEKGWVFIFFQRRWEGRLIRICPCALIPFWIYFG